MKTVRRKLTMTYEDIDSRGYTETNQTIRTSEYADGLQLWEIVESFAAFVTSLGYSKESIYDVMEDNFKDTLES